MLVPIVKTAGVGVREVTPQPVGKWRSCSSSEGQVVRDSVEEEE